MKILQIGCGNMGRAVFDNCKKLGYDVTILETKKIDLHARLVLDFSEIKNEKFDIIILAIKPQNFLDISEKINKISDQNTKIISIMAAISIESLKNNIPSAKNFTRIMPNLGILKNCGVSLFLSSNSANTFNFCSSIFGDGENILIEVENDEKMDKVTPMTGSAMAYFLLFAKKLKEYAIRNFNFDEEISNKICKNILKSSLDLANLYGFDVGIEKISSKGGITAAATDAMEKNLELAVQNAMESGFNRAREMK